MLGGCGTWLARGVGRWSDNWYPSLGDQVKGRLIIGNLNAAVSSPPVTVFDNAFGFNLKIIVNDPGQNCWIK